MEESLWFSLRLSLQVAAIATVLVVLFGTLMALYSGTKEFQREGVTGYSPHPSPRASSHRDRILFGHAWREETA